MSSFKVVIFLLHIFNNFIFVSTNYSFSSYLLLDATLFCRCPSSCLQIQFIFVLLHTFAIVILFHFIYFFCNFFYNFLWITTKTRGKHDIQTERKNPWNPLRNIEKKSKLNHSTLVIETLHWVEFLSILLMKLQQN